MRRLRVAAVLVAALFVAAGSALVPAIRDPVLRAAGHALVSEDTLAPADIIVLAPDVGEAGVLEAADLIAQGWSQRVAILAPPLPPLADEFERRKVAYTDEGMHYLRLLYMLGVDQAALVRMATGGTSEAGRFLPGWSAQRRVRTILLITSTDHSRRMQRVMRRHFSNSSVRVSVRRARYSAFAPERWWKNRGTLRTGLIELEKLAVDVVGHPFS